MTRLTSISKAIVKVLLSLTLFGLSVWHLASVNWFEVFGKLRDVDPAVLMAAFTMIPVFWFFRTWRWGTLLHHYGVAVRFKTLFVGNAIAIGFANYTPAQLGEAIKVELVNRVQPIDKRVGYSVFILEKLIDLMLVVLVSSVCLAVVGSRVATPEIRSVAFIASTVVIGLLIGLMVVPLPSFWRKHFNKILGPCGKRFVIAEVSLASLGAWLNMAVVWYLCLLSLDIEVEYIDVLLLMMLISLIAVVSVIPGGIGIREAGVAWFLVNLGVTESDAVSAALVIRLLSLVVLSLSVLIYFARTALLPRRATT